MLAEYTVHTAPSAANAPVLVVVPPVKDSAAYTACYFDTATGKWSGEALVQGRWQQMSIADVEAALLGAAQMQAIGTILADAAEQARGKGISAARLSEFRLQSAQLPGALEKTGGAGMERTLAEPITELKPVPKPKGKPGKKKEASFRGDARAASQSTRALREAVSSQEAERRRTR